MINTIWLETFFLRRTTASSALKHVHIGRKLGWLGSWLVMTINFNGKYPNRTYLNTFDNQENQNAFMYLSRWYTHIDIFYLSAFIFLYAKQFEADWFYL